MKKILFILGGLVCIGAGCYKTADGPAYPMPMTTPSGVTSSSSTPPVVTEMQVVKLFFVALGDGTVGKGDVGCGDTMQAVDKVIPATTTPLAAALRELLAAKGQFYEQTGLYNALYQSNLKLQSATIVNGAATVKLTGTTVLGGVCDEPRFETQLQKTILQFPSVEKAEIFINGKPIKSVISGR